MGHREDRFVMITMREGGLLGLIENVIEERERELKECLQETEFEHPKIPILNR